MVCVYKKDQKVHSTDLLLSIWLIKSTSPLKMIIAHYYIILLNIANSIIANLAWFANYLNGRKQYIKITESADTVKRILSMECRKAQY